MSKTKLVVIISSVIVILFVLVVFIFGSFSSYLGTSKTSKSNSFLEGGVPFASLPNDNFVDRQEEMVSSQSYDSIDSKVNNVSETSDKKIIKNGNLTLKVNSVDKVVESIGFVAKNNGGDIFSSNFSKNSQDQKSGSLSVKVPVFNFEKTYEEIKKVATVVVRESTSGQDVTEQYIDLEAQVRNKKIEEEAYQKILDQAQKVEDIIAVTKSLSTVRGEIERLEGKLRYLSSQTDMSTIVVAMSEDVNLIVSDSSWRPFQVFKDSIQLLVLKTQDFLNSMIVFFVIFIPIIIVYLIIFWIVYKIGKIIFLRIFGLKKEEKKENKRKR